MLVNFPTPDCPFSPDVQRLITRWYRMRKLGKCRPLLQDGEKIYTYDPVGRWDTKVRISLDELHYMVQLAELEVQDAEGKRKAVCSETGLSAGERSRRAG